MTKSVILHPSLAPGGPNENLPPFDVKAYAEKYGGTTEIKVRTKQAIYSQGESADSVYYLRAGKVQISVLSKAGREACLGILEAGDFCGEGCLIGESARVSTAQAITKCALTRFDRAALVRAIHEETSIAEFFALRAMHLNRRLKADFIDHLFNSSEKRLARILLELANFGKEGRWESAVGKIDQQTLARLVGTTRSRINFFMNKFRRLGYIEYNGDISVHSSLLSVILHDQSPAPLKRGGSEQPEPQ